MLKYEIERGRETHTMNKGLVTAVRSVDTRFYTKKNRNVFFFCKTKRKEMIVKRDSMFRTKGNIPNSYIQKKRNIPNSDAFLQSSPTRLIFYYFTLYILSFLHISVLFVKNQNWKWLKQSKRAKVFFFILLVQINISILSNLSKTLSQWFVVIFFWWGIVCNIVCLRYGHTAVFGKK